MYILNITVCVCSQMQANAGFELTTQAPKHDLASKLKPGYITQVAAHLTLQQLQVFSCDVLPIILAFQDVTPSPSGSEGSEHTNRQCANIKAQ